MAMVKVMTPVTLNPPFYHCRLISAVFKLCEVEKNACTAKMVDALSPQVTSSTMWLLRRWSRSYLLPDENYYTQVGDTWEEPHYIFSLSFRPASKVIKLFSCSTLLSMKLKLLTNAEISEISKIIRFN